MIRKLLRILFVGVIAVLLAMLLITFLNTSKQPKVCWQGNPKNDTAAISRFSKALQFQTVTYDDESDGVFKMAELEKMQDWMRVAYPLCFAKGNIEILETGSMLCLFKGKNPALKPALFLAHLDVVPVDSQDLRYWKFLPFSGKVDHDTIYGRGTLDDKVVAIALLEAMERMLKAGKQPERDVMFAFGHDEESGGHKGAAGIAEMLESKGIHASFIMDEGLGVTEGIVPGIQGPVALIGLAEKGYMSLKLTVQMDGGHSSMPKFQTATSVLTEALHKIDNYRFQEKFPSPVKQFLSDAAPEMGFGYRFLFSNLWVTSPVVKMVMRGNEKTAASISTTHVTTVINSGVKDNVVPNFAEAMVNFRILSGETINGTRDEIEKLINDPRVRVAKFDDMTEPSPVSEASGEAWDKICVSVHETFNKVITAPGQVIAVTDCQHYYKISDHVYRFVPLRLNNKNTSGIHGINERIAVANYLECITFYQRLMEKI